MRAQVVVAGGGPVGMLVAAELAGYGVDTVVLEELAGVAQRPKATTLHARAVQCLARRGYLPGPRPAERTGEGRADFHFAGVPGLVITTPAAEPTPLLKLPQARLEELFGARAAEAGVRVLRRHRVSSVVQDPDGVRITAEGPDGPVVLAAEYLVGADGARSTVREAAGIASETFPATVSALSGVVRLPEAGALRPGWQRTPRGWIVARDDGGLMHIRTLNCGGSHRDRATQPTLEEFRREVSWLAGREIAMREPRWLSRFSDFTRVARTFRSGRILLAGDAAHVHFPIGGQGLSTGVLDALNLGWKLAYQVRGLAAPGLLDSYDAERRPAAWRVVDNTRAQLALMRPVAEADAVADLLGGLLRSDRGGPHLAGLISAQDTVYPVRSGCPSTGEGTGEGTYLPNAVLATSSGTTDVITLLRDGRPLLLLLGGDEARYREELRGWDGLLRVVAAGPTPAVPYEALILRPDGYILWAPGGGRPAEALAAYLGAGALAGTKG